MPLIAASDYPMLDVFWTIVIFTAWMIWFWTAITVLVDVFRRHDASGWKKAAWTVFIIVVPFLGVLVYLVANHDGMADRATKDVAASQAQFDEQVRRAAGTDGPATQIEAAKKLLDSGAITQAEFDDIKRHALESTTPATPATPATPTPV